MLDIKFIRANKEAVQEAAKNKNINLDVERLLSLDETRRELITKIANARSRQKKLGRENIEEAKKLKEEQKVWDTELAEISAQYEELMLKAPTVPSPDTPIGKNSDDNVEILKWGKIPKFDFEPKDHIQIGKDLDILDLERGAKVAGYRGYYIKNEGAQLIMALMMFAFNKMVEKGYSPMIVPTLLKEFALFGSGYFSGKEYDPETDEIYEIATKDKDVEGQKNRERKFLSGTAEPALLAYRAGEVLNESDLPLKICGFSQCYRSEIGSYGKDTKGLYRVHEFMKVEQVILAKADVAQADKLQQEMLAITREIHEELGLPYRLLQICTGDMGSGKYKMFDIEAWLPGLNRWGETGSASNFLDWQARRLNVKYKDKDGQTRFVYMLNNTAMPSVRPFIAILENYQQADGSVEIPKVLRPWMGGLKYIKRKK
ncbi:MAG: serine--tRNA ligase [Candidatus Buchananbacteria bacterium RIFCSPHIGHO2_01_FULL_39_8]|uniref:Serine--tRNA ligase n=1 Tax=Candidatus Buchananbacteria bacterium RIFCSPHIGHO2_01_FULL_39_8 TaxID=1797533 RepID=A0A1G1XUV3_9BACT|nr:MAG: serine--tRNA ligase [Candidatus Buchananbacteria bacterium RIFCSPHIGHO2_01_FULL_39_8]